MDCQLFFQKKTWNPDNHADWNCRNSQKPFMNRLYLKFANESMLPRDLFTSVRLIRWTSIQLSNNAQRWAKKRRERSSYWVVFVQITWKCDNVSAGQRIRGYYYRDKGGRRYLGYDLLRDQNFHHNKIVTQPSCYLSFLRNAQQSQRQNCWLKVIV